MEKTLLEQDSDIGELVRKAENDFTSATTHISKYVDLSLYEDISRIYAYLESKHTSGDTDSMGREKPFFNIVLAARNVWYRATDIDRKNVKIRSTKSSDDIGSFLATVHLQEWMRRENFGQFLNNWGINSAGFNETILKFVEQDGKLNPSIVPWNRIICDQIDFNNNPKIEILEMTEAQLRKNKSYNQELVEKLCDAVTARETVDRQKKDTKNNYIKLYEVHGELPLSYLTGKDEDGDEYVQQMHVISFVATKEKGKFDDFTLYSGKEAKDPYMITALLPEVDGSVALRGSVKTLFDAQWMQNHTTKAIKDQLDLASKLIFQTSDGSFVGQNVLTAIENGDVLIHKVNEPLTNVANNSHDITALQGYAEQWKRLGNEITGISESMLGQTAPSGTAWRQVDALLQENHSLFELMTENKGLAIEQMLREYVIPFLKKKMNHSKEISTTLKAHDITKIDSKYINNYSVQQTNKALKESILNGQPVSTDQQAQMTNQNALQAKQSLQDQGNQRFFAPSDIKDITWKELFKDLEWEVEVDVTNENLDKDALTTLNTMMMTLGKNPTLLDDPRIQMLWNKMLELTGAISTLEISSVPAPQPKGQPQNRVSESLSYKDAPPDIQRQIEAQAGLKPSTIQPAQPVMPQATPTGSPVGA